MNHISVKQPFIPLNFNFFCKMGIKCKQLSRDWVPCRMGWKFHLSNTYAKWKGNGMENITTELRLKSGMVSEWKRNGKGMENKIQIAWNRNYVEWNGIGKEMEWAFHEKKVDK